MLRTLKRAEGSRGDEEIAQRKSWPGSFGREMNSAGLGSSTKHQVGGVRREREGYALVRASKQAE